MTYLMWFSRYGSPHIEQQPTLEDCYDLDVYLENAEMWEFDQYGVLVAVENVGEGVVPDDVYEAGLDAYRARQDKELAANPAKVNEPVGTIYIRTPDKHARPYANEAQYCTYYDKTILEREKERLTNALGANRVRVQQYGR